MGYICVRFKARRLFCHDWRLSIVVKAIAIHQWAPRSEHGAAVSNHIPLHSFEILSSLMAALLAPIGLA
jgi:hypothetical protein